MKENETSEDIIFYIPDSRKLSLENFKRLARFAMFSAARNQHQVFHTITYDHGYEFIGLN